MYLFFGASYPETNESPLEINGWKMNFLLGPGLFSGDMLVSGRVSVLDGDLSLVAHLCYKKSFRNMGPRRAVT